MLLILFEGGNRTNICISKNNVAHRGKKSKDQVAFSKSTLKTSLKHLTQNCYFMVDNSLLRLKIDILMGTGPAPFRANLFLYTYENYYMPKVEARHFHSNKRFIYDLGTLNDGGVFHDI